MEKDRRGSDNQSGKKEEYADPQLKAHAELYPDDPDPIIHRGNILVKLYPDSYAEEELRQYEEARRHYEEVMRRLEARQSSTKPALNERPKALERTLKNGGEIILGKLRRAGGEIVHFITSRQQK